MFRSKKSRKEHRANVQRRSVQLEQLEKREMMTVSANVNPLGVLSIQGDELSNTIEVYHSGTEYMVKSKTGNGPESIVGVGNAVKSIDIRSFGGNDTINNSTLLRAVIRAGLGNDVVRGGRATDVVYGEAGNDTIYGNRGNDIIYGGIGRDLIYGEAGNDRIYGDDLQFNRLSDHNLAALGLEANDKIFGGDGNDIIWGQIGDDKIYGEGEHDEIHGGRGNDYLWGDNKSNTQSFGPNDSEWRNSRTGMTFGGDYLLGEDGNDTLYGGWGEDMLRGGRGNDTLYGGFMNDRIFGEEGVDSLFGEGNDDFLDAGSAAEIPDGGIGFDFNAYVTVVNGASFNDIKQGFSNNCFILASLSASVLRGVDLASRITYIGAGNYEVSLFTTDSSGNYVPTKVQVYFDGTLQFVDPKAHFRGQEGESWTVILNRALAQLLKVDLNTTTGGYAGNVLAALTGRPPKTWEWIDNAPNTTLIPDAMLDLLYNAGNAVPTIVGSRNTVDQLASAKVAADHVYVVHSVFISGWNFSPLTRTMVPQYTVLLYNPWGFDNLFEKIGDPQSYSGNWDDGLIALTGDEFKRNFDEITFA